MKKVHSKTITTVLIVIVVILAAMNIKSYYDIKKIETWAESIRKTHVESNQILEDKMHAFDTNLLGLQDKYYEDKITKLLGEEKLIAYAKDQWQYSIKANNLPFEEDHVYVSTKEVTLVLSQKKQGENLLPLSIQESGALASGDKNDMFYDHLIIESQIDYDTRIEEGDNFTNVYYSFNDVPRGTIITIRLSEPLRERLFINHDTLEIIINKV